MVQGQILISLKLSGFLTWCERMCGVAVLWPVMWRAIGCQTNPGSCWVMSWHAETFQGPHKGRCFSLNVCAKRCYRSQVCSICTHSSPDSLLPRVWHWIQWYAFGPEDYIRTSYKWFNGTALSSYLQIPKVRLFSGRRIFVIQAVQFGLLVLSLKSWPTQMFNLVILVGADFLFRSEDKQQ